MAIFGGKEKKEDKSNAKAQKYLSTRGIEGLDSSYSDQVNRISLEMLSNGLFKAGLALSFGNSVEQAKLGYMSAQVEQNWILIKQQDEILKELKKLNGNK